MKDHTLLQTNRPAAASGVSGALGAFLMALLLWGITVVPASVPAFVTAAGFTLGVAVIGAIGVKLGKIAQEHTWSEDSHKTAVAYATSLDPGVWREEIEQALGMTYEEAMVRIGADPVHPGDQGDV